MEAIALFGILLALAGIGDTLAHIAKTLEKDKL